MPYMIENIKKKDISVFLWVVSILTICMLPMISSRSYSIDDYHLWSVYDINFQSMGYAFYGTGRDTQGIIAQLLSLFNLQPFNKPLGAVLFIVMLGILGTFFSNSFKIEDENARIITALLFAINPFFTEIYYYTSVTIYSAFTVLFLWLAIKFSVAFSEGKRMVYAILAVVFYYLLLGIVQNYYPIAGVYLIILVIVDLFNNAINPKKYCRFVIVYVLSFFVYFVALKIKFFIYPPSLSYQNMSVSSFVGEFFSEEYWKKLSSIVMKYLFTDNTLNSVAVFIMVHLIVIFSLGSYIIKNRKNKPMMKTMLVIAYMLVMPFLSVGIGLMRLDNISGRCFTAVGLYEASLFLISFLIFHKEGYKKMEQCIMVLFTVVILVNGGLCGRASLNVLRLNALEENVVNRIVYRMEEDPDFTGREALLLYGVPELGQFNDSIAIGDFCVPASVSFSKVYLFNETSGYSFTLPTAEQVERAADIIENMETWPSEKSVVRMDNMYVIRFYW